ncbi:MAG: hydroxymethylglutaryl-CoA lyase [Chitinophagales bacterium]|jgi:hydroxymethylglutaryl-CoA lyase|nr:hydroxymethylglutaryl-CoA lyase [Chitinophagales bacterium]
MKIIECPRDAMQGINRFIPTEKKIEYINALLKVGFDTLDFGSFVSPQVIPQMADTWKVVQQLDMSETDTKLLAIVANLRGARDAVSYEAINYIGFPFSVSETFQQRNTNLSQQQAFELVDTLQEICLKHKKELVVYLSMGFGNPYGDLWHPALVEHWADRFVQMGISIISVADTVGVSKPADIAEVFNSLTYAFPHTEFGAHLHTEPHNWAEKVDAAYENGCHRFDGAIKGFGGCPMAQSSLVGNMPTENLLFYFEQERADFFINQDAFLDAMNLADAIFLPSEVLQH